MFFVETEMNVILTKPSSVVTSLRVHYIRVVTIGHTSFAKDHFSIWPAISRFESELSLDAEY